MSDEERGSLLAVLAKGQVASAQHLTSRGAAVPLSVAGLCASGDLLSVVAPGTPNTRPGSKVGVLLAAHDVNAWSAMWTVPQAALAPDDDTSREGSAIITWMVGPSGVNEIEAWTLDGQHQVRVGAAQDAPESLLVESAEALSMSAAWARARTADLPEIGVIRDALTAGLRQEGMHVSMRNREAVG